MEPTTTTVWARLFEPATVIGLLTFITLVAGWIRADFVEKRKRKYDAEDRARLEKEAAEARDRIARNLKDEGLRIAWELKQANEELAREVKAAERAKAIALQIAAVEQRDQARLMTAKIDANTALTEQLQTSLDENTEISTRAFHEANTVNNKIAALGVEILQVETNKVSLEVAKVLDRQEVKT